MRKATLALFIMSALLLMTGCGGPSSVTAPVAGSNVPVGLTITDTPPNGVSVLFFQLNITDASLSPGNVALLSRVNPIPVNVSQLQTEVDFLGSRNVAEGTYSSLSVTFANPQLTIYNGSGAAIGTCADKTVCNVTPASSGPLTLTFSTSPFPITLAANSPVAFKLDIHLNTVIQPDLNLNLAALNGVTLSQVSPPQKGRPIRQLGKLTGTVQSLGTNQFTLQGFGGRTFSINVDSSTTYGYPSSVCAAGGFSCLAAGQVVKVTVDLQSDGTLLASEVDYVQPATTQTVEAKIIGLGTSGGNTVMDLIVLEAPNVTMSSLVPIGRHVRVTVPTAGVTYAVDSGSFAIPAGLSFASAADLQVGQEVRVVVEGSVTTTADSTMSNTAGFTPVGPAAIGFTTNSIALEPSQITGTVATVDASSLSFTLATFPAYFLPPSPIASSSPILGPIIITVQTTAATTFVSFTTNNLSGLAVNDLVSLHGWVFATPSAATKITVAADKVLARPAPAALF
jgi:Domain of unknown function (DUF5666)